MIQFISLYFVPLSSLLISSILSLKCNHALHIMFFDGNIFGTEFWEGFFGLARLPSPENKNILFKMESRVSYVFDHNKKEKDFDICIKQKAT